MRLSLTVMRCARPPATAYRPTFPAATSRVSARSDSNRNVKPSRAGSAGAAGRAAAVGPGRGGRRARLLPRRDRHRQSHLHGDWRHQLRRDPHAPRRRRGERHTFNPDTIANLQHAVRQDRYDTYKAFAKAADDEAERLCTLRGLLRFKKSSSPVPLDEVEPVERRDDRRIHVRLRLLALRAELTLRLRRAEDLAVPGYGSSCANESPAQQL